MGSNNAGEIDPLSASQAAVAFGVRIYTIGMGSVEQGEALDEETLREIATISNGRYFNALSLDDLQNVYEQIDRLEQTPIERQLTIQWQEQAWLFLIMAMILLIIERVLRQTIFQTIP